MKISKLNQFNHIDNTSAGFTLIEMLATISIMGIVSALVGTGITFMVSSNQKLAAAQSRRVEVSQALDVISYDIRRSDNVNGTNTTPTALSDFTPVLFLNISIVCSGTTIIPEQVIYSTKANAPGDGRVGSNSLYRYGRIADANDSIPCSGNDPVNVPIADNITIATTTPTCSPTATATSAGANGFYTCVSDKRVSVALFAKLIDSLIYGDNRTITSGSMASIATGTGGNNITTPTTIVNCKVPNLWRLAPSNAREIILGNSPASPPDPSYTGLSASSIPTTGGSTVISQTPSADSLIPCQTGLVTYTY